MIIICMDCKRKMGEKEPLRDKDETHSICVGCAEIRYSGGKKVKNIIKDENNIKVSCKKWYELGEVIPLRQCEVRQEVVGNEGFLLCQNCKERKR